MKSKAFNELVEHWSNPDLQQSVVDRLKASMKNYMSSEF